MAKGYGAVLWCSVAGCVPCGGAHRYKVARLWL